MAHIIWTEIWTPNYMIHIIWTICRIIILSKPIQELMVQRLYVNPKLIELVLDECSFCPRFYLYEKGIAYELECFLNTLLEKRDQKFIGGQIELLQRKIETLQFIKMMLEVCLRRGFKVLPNRWRSPLFERD